MLSTFEAENRHLDKHTQPQLKKRCAYKKKMCTTNFFFLVKNSYFLTECVDDLCDLVGSRFTEKENAVIYHLRHDATGSPHVNLESVVLSPKHQLHQRVTTHNLSHDMSTDHAFIVLCFLVASYRTA